MVNNDYIEDSFWKRPLENVPAQVPLPPPQIEVEHEEIWILWL